MLNSRIDGSALSQLYFGDRDLLEIAVDVGAAEARLTFSGARLAVASAEGVVHLELARPVLVVTGLRSFGTHPASARAETIVLKWRLLHAAQTAVGEFMVVGNPEPVTLRFEGEGLHLET